MGTNSDEMYVIQSGIVEIRHKHDKGQDFVIEKLYRGSIINHNSFLMNDEIDTDAKCGTTVSLFYINMNKIKELRNKHIQLEKALIDVEMALVNPGACEPAIDYIINDPYTQRHFMKHH